MRFALTLVTVALLATTALSTPADFMVTQKTHTDAYSMGPKETPAKDVTSVMWIGKDRMRIEKEDSVMIIRMDTKKMYQLDTKAKTATTIDLPFDIKKYVPPEAAKFMDNMPKPKCTVTTSDEKKKIKDWNTTKVTLEISTPTGAGGSKQDMWVTKDVPLDVAAYHDMMSTMFTMMPGGASMTDELKKIEGMPVLVDKTEKRGQAEIKSHEEIVSIEKKDAPDGAFDVPKDYTDKPFDPMSGKMGGPGGPGGPGGRHGRGDEAPVRGGKDDPK